MANKTVATAGLLSLILAAVHVFGGGTDVHAPILASDLDVVLKGYASVLWHGITASLLLCSVILLYASKSRQNLVALTSIVILQYVAYAAIFIFYGVTRLGSITVMPQWIAFLLIAGLAAFGLFLSHRTSGGSSIVS